MSQQVTPGRIVIFHPNGDTAYPLPNQMEIAPAIVTQVFNSTAGIPIINATLVTANPGDEPCLQVWSIRPKEEAIEGIAYWDWPPRV